MAAVRVLRHAFYKRHILFCSAPNTYLWCSSNSTPSTRQHALYSTKKSVTKVHPQEGDNEVQVSFGEAVKKNTEFATYTGVIVAAVGIAGYLLYIICSELFFSNTPTSIYTKAVDLCLKDPKVLNALGEPIKAYGMENRRGRRRYADHRHYVKDGVQHMLMSFYLQGTRRRAKVSLDAQKTESGDYEFTYLYAFVDDIVKTIIPVIDNRPASYPSDFDQNISD